MKPLPVDPAEFRRWRNSVNVTELDGIGELRNSVNVTELQWIDARPGVGEFGDVDRIQGTCNGSNRITRITTDANSETCLDLN